MKPECWMEHLLSHVFWQECGRGSGREGMLSSQCCSRKPRNVAGETDRVVLYLRGPRAAFRGVCGAAQGIVFLTIWDFWTTSNFHLTQTLPGSGDDFAPCGDEAEFASRQQTGNGERGPLWNSLMRLEGTGETKVLLLPQQQPQVQTEAGAAGGKEGR